MVFFERIISYLNFINKIVDKKKFFSRCPNATQFWHSTNNKCIVCPMGFYKYLSSCYYPYEGGGLTWSNSETYCNKLYDSHLIVIETPTEHNYYRTNFLHNIVGYYQWIGISLGANSGDPTKPTPWKWIDGNIWNFTTTFLQ